jgi:hypothetical protein
LIFDPDGWIMVNKKINLKHKYFAHTKSFTFQADLDTHPRFSLLLTAHQKGIDFVSAIRYSAYIMPKF